MTLPQPLRFVGRLQILSLTQMILTLMECDQEAIDDVLLVNVFDFRFKNRNYLIDKLLYSFYPPNQTPKSL